MTDTGFLFYFIFYYYYHVFGSLHHDCEPVNAVMYMLNVFPVLLVADRSTICSQMVFLWLN